MKPAEQLYIRRLVWLAPFLSRVPDVEDGGRVTLA